MQTKTLLLIRHAKSSWDDPVQQDYDRPLNDRGKTDAPAMAKTFT
jgi:phosphohistidine phosphatase